MTKAYHWDIYTKERKKLGEEYAEGKATLAEWLEKTKDLSFSSTNFSEFLQSAGEVAHRKRPSVARKIIAALPLMETEDKVVLQFGEIEFWTWIREDVPQNEA